MNADQYSVSGNQLIICDPELGIEISAEFALPRLPLNLQETG